MDITGSIRSASKAEEFEVVAVFPQLTLRHGGVPTDATGGTGFLRTSSSNGGESKPVGFLSFRPAVDGAQTVATLVLNNTEKLEFNRFVPITLRDIAPLHAAHKIYNRAEIFTQDDKREITRLVVSKSG